MRVMGIDVENLYIILSMHIQAICIIGKVHLLVDKQVQSIKLMNGVSKTYYKQ